MKPIKTLFLLASLLIVMPAYAQKATLTDACSNKHMTLAYNEFTDAPFPEVSKLPHDLAILVKSKQVDFVSPMEKYHREQARVLDTSVFDLIYPKWRQFSTAEKRKFMEQQRLSNGVRADSLHKLSLAAKQLVYVVNNTGKEIKIGVQDFSFICILEAVDLDNKWKPVQYWRYSKCGNSYITKHILPGKALAFIADDVSIGNYQTKLRYKLLGPDKFYYSNEFNGRIDYCRFTEDEYEKGGYKLETFQTREFSFGER
ncbi:hypothetical protein KXQ82_18185 [Mucilaginibacter sp. HMF5004]|uniref:hypothetical protein n=1 Tax=Mucilaginibacter rivuli TaxID=2857527 RepID=UPI001C5E455A|nr:hypothetical protein [Mucilaginibacter rivuli]MBW4891661.1 hypothetical protein [Mucilaginibacter rivuli]